MEVIVRPTACQAVALVAQLMEVRIRDKPCSVLGLATGQTMEKVYQRLSASGVSFKQCASFNLDEYIGLNPSDPNSYRYYMHQHLFSKIDIQPENTHVPEGHSDNLEQAAANYEQLIDELGPIDLQLLGIGVAGHIGFNEPLSSLMSSTRAKALTPETRLQNAAMFGGDPASVPKRALTMGVGTILKAREILLLATGERKASILAKAIEGPVTAMVTASALQLHPNCKVIADESAAAELQGREYYDFVFNNEPEWEDFRPPPELGE